ncbi:hypothetical protein AX17_001843 [Amanita inopinata Kibby_2008]|nr:hypothetical protein AX17_001843 [Amanita inopinata Kibby_2008]
MSSHTTHESASELGFVSANKEHFDHIAHEYDDKPDALLMAQKCAATMLNAYTFKENETVVMDYACGTGLISRQLAPHAKAIVGVDISQGMVDQYNLRVSNQGIGAEEMRAICAELEGREGELDGMRFDVIVCGLAYHHIESTQKVTQVLAHFLKPGGSLLVVDLEKTDSPIMDSHRHIVPHRNGLEEAVIQHAFESAGLVSFSYRTAFEAKLHGYPVALFLAKGVKPAS